MATTYHDFYTISYFTEAWVSCEPEQAYSAEVKISHGLTQATFKFDLADDYPEFRQLISGLEIAFERGKEAKQKEIKQVLGIIDPRQ